MMDELRLKELFEKYLNGHLTAEEKELFFKAVLDSRYQEVVEEMVGTLWNNGNNSIPTEPSPESIQRINRIIKSVRPPVYKRLNWYKIAAAAVLISAVVTGLIRFRTSKPTAKYLVTTLNGERKNLTLPDGSQVYLNAASSIEYSKDFNRNNRIIKLTGEAFFEVSPAGNKPFIVKSSHQINTQVIGTSFNIKDYENEPSISIAVISGKVKVLNNDVPLSVLEKDTKLIYEKQNRHFQLEKSDTTSWNNGFLVFKNDSLKHVMSTLSRTFATKISISHEVPDFLLVNACLDENLGLHKILELICKLHELKYSERNNQIIIYKYK
ncbi:FecR family protein [Chitinophaga silvatica]|uniref:FecR family protein n=1 Tax=Chitinophaga silvatica TaxID=2282649 RepID=A0A3E1Y2C1_9BACT|nr:FecR family protein [Chitinophaga silvatica]RFS18776.1 FecR family protein [Chitinophaga silvatica]